MNARGYMPISAAGILTKKPKPARASACLHWQHSQEHRRKREKMTSTNTGGKVFGVDLAELCKQQGVKIPKFVTHALEFLRARKGMCHVLLLFCVCSMYTLTPHL